MTKPNEVKLIAVENFLGSLQGMTAYEATMNCDYDAKMYRWNAATVKAIKAGIKKHYKK